MFSNFSPIFVDQVPVFIFKSVLATMSALSCATVTDFLLDSVLQDAPAFSIGGVRSNFVRVSLVHQF